MICYAIRLELVEAAYTENSAHVRHKPQTVEHGYALEEGLVVRVGCPALDWERVGWALVLADRFVVKGDGRGREGKGGVRWGVDGECVANGFLDAELAPVPLEWRGVESMASDGHRGDAGVHRAP